MEKFKGFWHFGLKISLKSHFLAVFGLFLQILSISRAEIPAKMSWVASSSALQEPIYAAQNVCDDDLHSRWSSPAADPQWIQIDLQQTCTVSGLTIHWETGFSSKYKVDVSCDQDTWSPAYMNENGDGGCDYVFFAPVVARYLRITGTKRATGWGHSIWEIDVHGTNESPIIFSSITNDTSTPHLCDGNYDSVYFMPAAVESELMLDLQLSRATGGVRIDWEQTCPDSITLLHSQDGTNWQTKTTLNELSMPFDLLSHAPTQTRFLKFILTTKTNRPTVGIKEITLLGPEYALSPLNEYQLAAIKAPKGHYPEHLHNRQVYWTIVGTGNGDSKEALFDEYGNLEPWHYGPTIMPYIYNNNALMSAMDATSVTQHLAEGYLPLPTVEWNTPTLNLTISTVASGPPDHTYILTQYNLKNVTDRIQTGKFYLVIRPIQINPPWQYGGLASITNITFNNPPYSHLIINNKPFAASLTPPTAVGAKPFQRGDIISTISNDQLPDATSLQDPDGRLSAAFQYAFALPANNSTSILICTPFYGSLEDLPQISSNSSTTPYFQKIYAHEQTGWVTKLNQTKIKLPDHALSDTLRSQLAYMMINRDGSAIQPGSRQYERSWIRDAAMSSAALLRMGADDPVLQFIDWYAHFITPEGMVPPSFLHDDPLDAGPGTGIEWDGQGAFVYAVMEYYRFIKDQAFLTRHYTNIYQSLQYLQQLREDSLAPDYMQNEPHRERFQGILTKSISHEGYYPEMHSYWDDFWALKGWKDGKEAAQILNDTKAVHWMQQQYTLLRNALSNSMVATIDYHNINHIPGCAEKGDFDPTSTSIAFYPCDEPGLLPTDKVSAMYNRYYTELTNRLSPDWNAGFTPYEIRNSSAFVGLDQSERATFLLDFIMNSRRPSAWNHVAEVVLKDPRMGCYIGDMPHTWAGSGIINAVLNLLVINTETQLILFQGAPASWFMNEGISLKNLPTWFGPLDLTATYKQETQTLDIHLNSTNHPPEGYTIYWPQELDLKHVQVNDEQHLESRSQNSVFFTTEKRQLQITP